MKHLWIDHPMVAIHHAWQNFSATEHETWRILFERQSQVLKDRAVDAITQGMATLAICHTKIPKFEDLNALLQKTTGFSIIPVKGFIPEDCFFKCYLDANSHRPALYVDVTNLII